PKLSSSWQDSARGVSGADAAAACGSDQRLRDVVRGIASSSLGVSDATSAGWRARPRRKKHPVELFPGDNRCAADADTPAGCTLFVGVGKSRDGKAPGSSGNTGSNSFAVLFLLGARCRTSKQNKTAAPQTIESSCRVSYRVLA